MSVTLGGIVFDGATGTPRTAMTPSQAAGFSANAKTFRWQGAAPLRQGSAELWLDCTRATAEARLRAVYGLTGTRVSLVYPHGTIASLPVGEVTGEWQAKAGTVNGGILVVRVDFTPPTGDPDGDPAAKSTVILQTAPALAGPWTSQDWIVEGGAEGLGTYLGETEGYALGVAPVPALLGVWARLAPRASADPDADAFWWGLVTGVTAQNQQDKGAPQKARTTYRMAGIGHALAQVYLTSWYESRGSDGADDGGGAPTTVADVGTILPFNLDGLPNRSAGNVTLPGGAVCKVHARGAPAEKWSALDAATTILAHLSEAWGGFVVELSGAGVLLDYTDTWDLRGMSVLEMLNAIISPDRGRTFRLEPNGTGGIAVVIVDLLDAGAEYDLRGDAVRGWTADLAAEQTVDRFYVEGPRPWWLRTVRHTLDDRTLPGACPLWRGWTAAQGTAWAAADETRRGQGDLGFVHRRFILQWAWPGDGRRAGVERLPYARTVDANGQETGALEAGPAAGFPHGRAAWTIDRTIPTGPGKDWSDSYVQVDPRDEVEGPLVWWYKAGEALDPVHYDLQVSVGDDGASVVLGRDGADAETIRAKLADGFSILATLSFLHPLPGRVSAVGGVGGIGAAAPRTDLLRSAFYFASAEYWRQIQVAPETIFKLDDAGAWVYAATGRKDRGGDLTEIRDRLARYFLTPAGSVSWTRGDVVTGADAPICGAVVSGVLVRFQSGTDAIVTIGAPVTRRAWSFVPGAEATTFHASRIVPGFPTPRIANKAGAAQALAMSEYEAEVSRRK